MNLHAIATDVISAVNPNDELCVRVSTGSTVDASGKRQPLYAPECKVLGQVQALSYSDIQHMDALNIQGERRAIYLSGRLDGLVRPGKKGGDLITSPDGNTWLVVQVAEYWPDWCKVLVTLQNDTWGGDVPIPSPAWPG